MNKELIKRLSIITQEEEEILKGQKDIDRDIYTGSSDLVVDSKRLLEKGKLIQIRTHTRFVHFPKHRHNYVEVIYMCQGETTHFIDEQKVVLKKGELLFLNQNAVQEISPAKEEDIAINFIILPEFFQVAFSMLKEEKNYLRDFLIESLGGGSNSTSYLWFHVTHELPIQNLVENMVWSILNDQPNKRSINQNTMGLLILQLLNYMDKMEAGTNAYEKEFTITVFNYIENHYKNGTLAELAGLLKRDIYWVSKEIKKRTGKTYKDLLMEKRLSQSGYLLKNTKLPVASIIEMVGYDNSSYFYRKFKETYQKTPNEYREESDKLGPC